MVARNSGSVARDPVLWFVVAVTTVARGLLAWRYFGFLGGDDLEVLEEAFRRAVGLAYSPWTIRNLLIPDLLVAPLLHVFALLGIRDVGTLALIAVAPFLVLASLNVFLVYKLTTVLMNDRAVARIAATIYAFHWIPLAFGSTVYPRTAAVTCILLAALSLAGCGRDMARGLAAGALLSVAFADRYSEGLFLLPLLGLCLASGTGRAASLRRALGVLGGFVVGAAVTAGLFDVLTWGRPFASLLALSRLTLVDHASSSRIASQGPLFYLGRLPFWLPPTLLPVLPYAWRERRLRAVWLFLLVPVTVLSLVFHKELRYLQGAIPFLAILCAAGLNAARRRWPHAVVTTLLVLALASDALGVRILRGKSMAAVTAAGAMASDPSVRVVALSQAWAYGDRLYFGNRVEVRDLPTPPGEGDIEAKAAGANRVALYRKDLAQNPALAAVLARQGFARSSTVEWGESKTVVVFCRD